MKNITMKNIFKRGRKLAAALAVAALGFSLQPAYAQAPVVGSVRITDPAEVDETVAKVYYTKHIDAEHLLKLYEKINANITGKVVIKLHSGEPHGPNILPRSLVEPLYKAVPNSALADTNTLYGGARDSTKKHRQTLKINGWTFAPFDILDEDGYTYLPVGKEHFHLGGVAMGSHIKNYDSMIVLTHYKGHTSGGFGGSLKNIAIGNADGKVGKRQVHGHFLEIDLSNPAGKDMRANEDEFMENMADSGKATLNYFGDRIVFINVMRRMSIDCDCAGTHAAEPKIADLGIMASTDLLAIDQASTDLVYEQAEEQKHDLVERIETRHGLRQLSAMKELGMGKGKYILISIDED